MIQLDFLAITGARTGVRGRAYRRAIYRFKNLKSENGYY